MMIVIVKIVMIIHMKFMFNLIDVFVTISWEWDKFWFIDSFSSPFKPFYIESGLYSESPKWVNIVCPSQKHHPVPQKHPKHPIRLYCSQRGGLVSHPGTSLGSLQGWLLLASRLYTYCMAGCIDKYPYIQIQIPIYTNKNTHVYK